MLLSFSRLILSVFLLNSEMKKKSFNEHQSGKFFFRFSFHFIYFSWGDGKVFHFAWLHFGETHKTSFFFSEKIDWNWFYCKTGEHKSISENVNFFNWQFMIDNKISWKVSWKNKSVGKKAHKKFPECVLGEKGFDFIIYHVLLGLNVYSRSKTQKSEI